LDWALDPGEKANEAEFTETIRVLVDAGGNESLIQDLDILRRYNSCSADAFAYLSQQCFPSYHQLPTHECVGIAVDLATCGLRLPVDGDSFQVLRLALQPISLQDAARAKTDSGGVTTRNQMTLLHACAFRLIMETNYDVSLERVHWRVLNCENPWRVFIRDLINAGAEISAVDSGGHSPLHDLLNNFARYPSKPEGPVQVLTAWLSDLKEAGVDLEQYGQTEFALHQGLATNSECCRHFPEEISFIYGRQVDWYFWLKGPTNMFAAQFWKMVEGGTSEPTPDETPDERQSLGMPGSWRDFGVEDEDDSDN
jgi:hypothetical protein